METVIMNPQTKGQLAALKAVAKALDVKFDTSKALITPPLLKRF